MAGKDVATAHAHREGKNTLTGDWVGDKILRTICISLAPRMAPVSILVSWFDFASMHPTRWRADV